MEEQKTKLKTIAVLETHRLASFPGGTDILMDHTTHEEMVRQAENHIADLKAECDIYRAALPDPGAKHKLKVALEHIAEHQKDLETLKNNKPKYQPRYPNT